MSFIDRTADLYNMKLKIGGRPITLSRLKHWGMLQIVNCCYSLIAFPGVVLLRLLKPLVLFRFEDIDATIGFAHIWPLELYLCEHDLNLQKKGVVDIFYTTQPAINHFFIKKWQEHVHLYPQNRLLSTIDKINRRIPGYQDHVIAFATVKYFAAAKKADSSPILTKIRSHLTFTPEEKQIGEQALREMGISENTSFICFHVRDRAFKEGIDIVRDWSYHDYRDANIQNYLLFAETFSRQGYAAVRMGATVIEPLNTTNPMIIDYPLKYRTEMMDFYLGAYCHFFITSQSGNAMIPMLFRKPTIVANAIPMDSLPSWTEYDFFIPKKLWLRKEKRFLTFREIVNSDICHYFHSYKYERDDIEIMENTEKEICDAGIEMESRLAGTWETTEEEVDLQQRFQAIVKNSNANNSPNLRIGIKFIRDNISLLSR